LETDLPLLEARVGVNESDIGLLEGRVGTNESDITSLEGRVGTNESDITSLEGRVGTNESDISALGGTWRSGTGTPSGATGENGDYYHNSATDDIYGPKAAGAWPGTPLDLGGGDDLPLYQSVWCPVDLWSIDPGPVDPGDTDFDEPLGAVSPLTTNDRPGVFRSGGSGNFLLSRVFAFQDNTLAASGMYIPCPDRYTGGPVKLKLVWAVADAAFPSLGDTAVFNFRGGLFQPDTACSVNSFAMGTPVAATTPLVNAVDAVQEAVVTMTPNNQGITYIQNNGALLYVFFNIFGTSTNHEVGDCLVWGLWAQFPLDTTAVNQW
jgi:hypothetical protein